MGNSKSKTNKENNTSNKGTKLDLNLHGYPPINFRKNSKEWNERF